MKMIMLKYKYHQGQWKKGWIFVFGSNWAGKHGAFAAKFAKQYCGAVYGQPEGLQGSSYALPTMTSQIRPLTLSQIKENVDIFIEFALSNSHLTFFVTRVACGSAGYTDNQIAPLFQKVSENCLLPPEWKDVLEKLHE